MKHCEQQFFALMRSGLWGKPINGDLFSEVVDWDSILKMASMQTVIGVLFDGISVMPQELQAPSAVMRKLYQSVLRIEQSHELMSRTLAKIVPPLQEEGISPILLKGQGVAQNYANPLRRQCGDIDLYVGKNDCGKAKGILLGIGAESETIVKSEKHENLCLFGVAIELHLLADKLRNIFVDAKFQRWTQKHFMGERLRTMQIATVDVKLPPVNFDALYIFIHFYQHFLLGGVGLRQLCDWAIYLHVFCKQIDREELLKDLKSFKMLRTWQIFGYIAVNYLGLEQDEFPFYSDAYKSVAKEIISEHILQTGNFGHYDQSRTTRPPGYFSGKLHHLKCYSKRAVRLFRLVPKDVFVCYLVSVINGAKQVIKDKLFSSWEGKRV